jgi:hypothetical protein
MTEPAGLLLRVFVEAADLKAAMACAADLVDLIGSETPPITLQIEPYWKIEGWQEVSFDLKADNCAEAFGHIADRLSPNWLFGGTEDDPDAVWSRREHGESLMGAAAQWAQIQLRFPPAD